MVVIKDDFCTEDDNHLLPEREGIRIEVTEGGTIKFICYMCKACGAKFEVENKGV